MRIQRGEFPISRMAERLEFRPEAISARDADAVIRRNIRRQAGRSMPVLLKKAGLKAARKNIRALAWTDHFGLCRTSTVSDFVEEKQLHFKCSCFILFLRGIKCKNKIKM